MSIEFEPNGEQKALLAQYGNIVKKCQLVSMGEIHDIDPNRLNQELLDIFQKIKSAKIPPVICFEIMLDQEPDKGSQINLFMRARLDNILDEEENDYIKKRFNF